MKNFVLTPSVTSRQNKTDFDFHLFYYYIFTQIE